MFTDGLKRAVRRAGTVALLAAALPAASAQAATDSTQFSVAGGSLGFDAAPDLPPFAGVTLNGQSQTSAAHMSDWAVTDGTGSGSGWNVTVQGDNGAGKSAVFKEYCTDPAATNGCDTAVAGGVGPGYVTSSPQTLAANSVSLSSTGAAFTALNGTTGTAPTHQCVASCNVDTTIPVKIAGGAAGAGMGTYQANSYGASSLSLALPTTVKTIGTGNKVYRLDLTWSINSGP
jgi:hypothetical protein